MAMDYFTSDHFKLLNKWKGQRRDDSNPEQNLAYYELKRAYHVTEEWARRLQEKHFPQGYFKVIKKPINQANIFLSYNWARIYPNKQSPKNLAYTVGIRSDGHFVVKIDTVQANSVLSKKFEEVRGPSEKDGQCAAWLEVDKGLGISLAELVEWSISAISKFSMSYDDIVQKLGLDANSVTADEENDVGETLDHQPINRIYYGPPGTGKTFSLMKLLSDNYTTQATSFSPEEWRTDQINTHFSELTWWEVLASAILELGGKVKVPDLEKHAFIRAKSAARRRTANLKQSIWGTLQHHTIEDSTTVKSAIRHAPAIFDKSSDSVWIMAGDWKEECAHLIDLLDELKEGPVKSDQAIQRYEFVTFHQSYGYEEFIEGLRPILGRESEQVSYEIRSGSFRRLCERARLDPQHAYAMVIDEVNRGNISKIFGELITLIEPDKRAGGEHAIEVTLPYSGDKFSVPRNVDVLGSMNTADRSLALVDTALRRRFEFVSVMPDPALLAGLVVSKDGIDIDLQRVLTVINQRIEVIFDRDHTIGHAFLLGIKEVPNENRFAALKFIFEKKIVPLLEEYFFDDWGKIRLVLGDNQKEDLALHFIQESECAVDLESLFGQDNELEGMRPRCTLNMKAFELPKAYVAIYDAKLMKTKPA